ncbi:hypothetical protein [Vagococcus fluvialis]|uniref:hypothetical protein n=1 Tax=Vagococcus fluvialis TaxID=2738 RepID=UPI003D1264BD
MRIDDENKVVWCSDSNDLAYVSGKSSLVIISGLIRYNGNNGLCDMQEYFYTASTNEQELISLAILKGYEFKLEQPQKYYWRKKKEHLAWFEEGKYLQKRGDNLYLARSSYDISKGPVNTFKYFTEQQARDLLKDDFDKFEKVECE